MKKWTKDFDFVIFVPTFILIVFGLLSIYSATYSDKIFLFKRQIIWIIIGILAGIIFYLLPLKFWNNFALIFYFFSVFLLIMVLFIGKEVHGVKGWFELYGIRMQPAELAKLSVVILMANFLSNKFFQIKSFRHMIVPIFIVGAPFVLIVLQPDIGTGLIFIFLAAIMLFFKGAPIFHFFVFVSPIIAIICGLNLLILILYLVLLGIILYFLRTPLHTFIPIFLINICFGLAGPLFWNKLKHYQRARIISFIFPSKDIKGTGWQSLQSKIALGAGGFFGRGFLKGTQKGLDFLPEVHTDFIFSAIGEEFGFLGCIVILACFFILLWRCIKIAYTARDSFNSFLAIGIGGVLGVQTFINIGVAVGIIPVIGIPLPFISYGGSSIIVSLSMIGLLLNIYKHRFEY